MASAAGSGVNDEARRTRWGLVALAAIVVPGLLALLVFQRADGVIAEAVPAVKKDLFVPILCDGTLEPPPGGERRAPEAAIVSRVLAREGQPVKQGTPLVALENATLAQAALDAKAEVIRLGAEASGLRAELAEARSLEAELKKTFDADERLLASGAVTRNVRDADRSAWEKAVERTRAASARLESIVGPSSRLELAQTSAANLAVRHAALLLRAPMDGVAYGLPAKTGEPVVAGQVVASVAVSESLRVRARVDEPDVPRIKPGQTLVVTFDGLAGKRFVGKVSQVSAGIVRAAGRDVGEVLAEIADTQHELPPNASVNVEIVVGESRGALAVPRAALFRDGDKRYVFRLERGHARRHNVVAGLIGLSDVEITSGLSVGDLVLLPGLEPIADGMKIRASH